MPLSLAQLEEIREDAMAEDVPIDIARMQHWSEQQAQLFFENGGQEEHEITAWLRGVGLLQLESALRLKVDTLEQLKTRANEAIASAPGGTHQANMGIDQSIAALKLNCAPGQRLLLRKHIKILLGLEEAPPAGVGGGMGGGGGGAAQAGAPKTSAVSAAQKAHHAAGAAPLAQGKKVIFGAQPHTRAARAPRPRASLVRLARACAPRMHASARPCVACDAVLGAAWCQ